jgi:hypothetical protein
VRRTRWSLSAPDPGESDRHKAILEMLNWALPHGAVWHTPNGIFIRGTEQERAAEWARMLALGALPGFPDIAIAQAGRLFTLEAKTPNGVQSPEQQAAEAKLRAAGVPYAIVHDAEHAYRVLQGWGCALRRLHCAAVPAPAVHSLVLPLTAEWHGAMAEAVRAWRGFLGAIPPRHAVFLELTGAENRLRQLALESVS